MHCNIAEKHAHTHTYIKIYIYKERQRDLYKFTAFKGICRILQSDPCTTCILMMYAQMKVISLDLFNAMTRGIVN